MPAPQRAHFNHRGGVALGGYDPVSYFQTGPREGSERIAGSYRGVRYHFASEDNRSSFLAQPQRYEPRYGGWCACAIVRGRKTGVDPLSFLVIEGELLLFHGRAQRDEWSSNPRMMRIDADRRWKKLLAPRE